MKRLFLDRDIDDESFSCQACVESLDVKDNLKSCILLLTNSLNLSLYFELKLKQQDKLNVSKLLFAILIFNFKDIICFSCFDRIVDN